MTSHASHRMPARVMAGLALAVLAIHLGLLQFRPGPVSLSASAAARPLLTRRVELPAPPAEPRIPPQPAPAKAEDTAASHSAPHAASPPPPSAPVPKPDATPIAPTHAAPPASLPGPPVAIVPGAAPAPVPDATATAAAPNTLQLPAAATLSFPGSVRLRYVVFAEYRRQPFRVSGALSWSHDGVSYQARMELNTPLTGTRRQTSTGRITADGLAPLRFLDEARSAQAAHFRRDTGVISFSNNAPDAPLARGAQDRLSVLLQLGAMLAGDPARYPPGSVISLQTAGTRDAETWVFGVGAAETLQLPGGALNTVKLERAPRHEFDQRVEVWLAPSMDHLPVRIRLTQPSGEVLDQQWEATDRS